MLSGPPLILDGSESGQEMYWERKESVKASAEERREDGRTYEKALCSSSGDVEQSTEREERRSSASWWAVEVDVREKKTNRCSARASAEPPDMT